MRFVVVGYGSIGARHLKNLRTLFPDAQIALLRRPVSAPRHIMGVDHVFTDMTQAINYAPDAAVIACPAPWHMPTAIRLARAGVHLFIEKPIAMDCSSARALIAECNSRSLVISVGYDLRFDPMLVKFRDLINAGAIGDVYSVRIEVGQYLPDWRPNTDYRQGVSAKAELGGGVLLELSHEFDYLQWIFGVPTRVMSLGGRSGQLDIDVEDIAEIIIEYGQTGPWASIHLDMLQQKPYRQCRVVGTLGSIVWDGIARRVELSESKYSAPLVLQNEAEANGNMAYLAELKNFVSSIKGQEVPACNGEDAIKALAIALAARQSMEIGRAVSFSEMD